MSAGAPQVAIAGAGGRMGRALVAAAHAAGMGPAAAFEVAGSPHVGLDAGDVAGIGQCGIAIGDDPVAAAAAGDVLVDFTAPAATLAHVEHCRAAGRAVVIGTTGLAPAQRAAVEAAAADVPIVLAPNMSVGVNLCFRLVEIAARALGDEVDVEIVEAHHRNKVDAPSGTAVRLGEIVAGALGRRLEECAVYAREGHTGARASGSIGFATVRGGDIVGEHTVMFAGAGERVEIAHRASSRENYARGALRAARWVVERERGLFDMQDVLGLR